MREAVLGLIGGTLIGSTGIGSGSLLTPLLILAGYQPSVAVSTGLATLIVSKLTGSIAHRSLGNWPGRQAWYVIGGGAAGVAVIASLSFAGVSPNEIFIRRAIAVSLFATAVVALRHTRSITKAQTTRDEQRRPDSRLLFAAGATVGALVTLTSAGSGSLLVPLLLPLTAWRVPQLAATSNTFGWMAALLAFALHVGHGSFDPRLFLLVLTGLLPGVISGALLSPRIDRRSLAPALSVLTVYLAVRLI